MDSYLFFFVIRLILIECFSFITLIFSGISVKFSALFSFFDKVILIFGELVSITSNPLIFPEICGAIFCVFHNESFNACCKNKLLLRISSLLIEAFVYKIDTCGVLERASALVFCFPSLYKTSYS